MKYDWLKNYQDLEQEIAILEFNIERNGRELKRWVGGDLSNISLTSESHGAKLEELIQAINNELDEKKKDLEGMKNLIGSFDGLEQQILFKCYVEKKSLKVVAKELNMVPNHIYNKHAEIKRTIRRANKINKKST